MFQELQSKQYLAICKKNKQPTSVAVATTIAGTQYWAGSVASDTHLLDYRAEQVACMMASQATDYHVQSVHVWQPTTNSVSLQVLQFLVDHAARSTQTIGYVVYGPTGEIIFETTDVANQSVYVSAAPILDKTVDSALSNSYIDTENNITTEQLRAYAVEAIVRNYPSSNSASGYGVAVRTDSGRVYYGGQYSSLEHRSGFHAESAVLTNMLMNDPDAVVTDIMIVSSKYPDTVCSPCGPCRQFIAEMCSRYNWSPQIHCAASETNIIETFTIDQLLPSAWTSGNL